MSEALYEYKCVYSRETVHSNLVCIKSVDCRNREGKTFCFEVMERKRGSVVGGATSWPIGFFNIMTVITVCTRPGIYFK